MEVPLERGRGAVYLYITAPEIASVNRVRVGLVESKWKYMHEVVH